MTTVKNAPIGHNTPSFEGLGLTKSLLNRLDQQGFTEPTPIQRKCIPIAITGEDVIGIAQTGTGKTLAFALPMIQRLAQTKGTGLVILPTRELALQVDEELQKIGNPAGLRTAVLIGGGSMSLQIRSIKMRPHIIIATPGRLNDHIQSKTISLHSTTILVLDEADRMLDMGFEPQIKRILATVPQDRQTMLFSATMPPGIEKIARNYMKQPLRVEVAPSGTTAENVDQELFVIGHSEKLRLLDTVLKEYTGSVLVFSRTKYGAKRIAATVRRMGHTASELHSNCSLAQRRKALDGFKSGIYRVLIATDIAARGIDVKNIELVINYDLPENPEDYVHRIGRTARAGKAGKAISFVAPEQRRDVMMIERLIRAKLTISPLPQLPERLPQIPEPDRFTTVRTYQRSGNVQPTRARATHKHSSSSAPAYRRRSY